jgi:hypothetical protein
MKLRKKTKTVVSPKLRVKRPVPTFASREEEAEFWQSHSSEDFLWEELAEPIILSPALKERVRQRSLVRSRSTKTRTAR